MNGKKSKSEEEHFTLGHTVNKKIEKLSPKKLARSQQLST